jgi:hypothetical protein
MPIRIVTMTKINQMLSTVVLVTGEELQSLGVATTQITMITNKKAIVIV